MRIVIPSEPKASRGIAIVPSDGLLVSTEMALRLEKAFGVSMDLLLRMQAGYDAAQVRHRSDQIEVDRFHPEPVP